MGGSSTETRARTVTVVAQARLIDEAGAALTSWTALDTFTVSRDSKDPLRFSRKIAAPLGAGRHEFRIMRTSSESSSSTVSDKVVLSGLRAYGGPHPDYGNVTLLEAKIKATDQLNGDASQRINVVSTRKLDPVTATGFDGTLAASRSIVDFCAYAVTAENGGRQDDSIIDWASLADLRSGLAEAGYNFDYRFTSSQSVMDACAVATLCGKAVPYMPGGLFSIVQDEIQALPACVFTRDNIEKLKITCNPRTPDTPTCVNITYTDPNTWENEVVTCIDDNGSEDNPSEITLDGCADRQQAYEIGMLIYWRYFLERTEVEFVTGLIGNIPTLLKKILVPNTMIDWGQDGLVKAVNDMEVWLSEPLDFKDADYGAMYISLPDGSGGGPYTVTPSNYTHCVYGSTELIAALAGHDLVKAPRYLFGPAEDSPMFVRVGKVQPQGKDKIKISGNLINDSVYDDPGTAPVVGSSVGTPPLLAGISLSYTGESDGEHAFLLSRSGSASAVCIYLDEGGGEAVLEDNYESFSLAFTTSANEITVKVVPYEDDVLQTDDALAESYAFLAAPTGLTVSLGTDGIEASWDEYADAISYNLSIFVESDEMLAISTSDTETSVSTKALELIGGPWEECDLELVAVTNEGVSQTASVTVLAYALDAPENLVLVSRMADGVFISWDSVSGAAGYRVYLGETADFTPGDTDTEMVYDSSASQAIIPGLDMSGDYAFYFRVAAYSAIIFEDGDVNWSETLLVEPESVTCTDGMLTSLEAEVSGTSLTLSWAGTATQFDILVEQDGEPDITVTQMTGSQRTITGLVTGDFTATVTPYRSDGITCDAQAETITGTIS